MTKDKIKEVKKNTDTITEVEKFNPYHGPDGRFAPKGGGALDMVGYLSQGMDIDENGKGVPAGSKSKGKTTKPAQGKSKSKTSTKTDRSKLTAKMDDLIARSAKEASKGNLKEANRLYAEGQKIFNQLNG